MDDAELDLPRTPAATAALEVARRHHSEAMLNHCVRSYLWAASLARQERLVVDEELLFVTAVLHDIGLAAAFDSHTLPFETAGGEVAWVFGAGAGWPVERRDRAALAIEQHMWDEVDPATHPEGYLLCVATGLDISGRDADRWPAELRQAVVERYPRLDLRDEFIGCLDAQARRKPQGAAAEAVASGIAARMAANPLDA